MRASHCAMPDQLWAAPSSQVRREGGDPNVMATRCLGLLLALAAVHAVCAARVQRMSIKEGED